MPVPVPPLSLRDRLLAHFPDVVAGTRDVHVEFPGGQRGTIRVLTVRQGLTGRIGVVEHRYGSEAPTYVLSVHGAAGAPIFPVPPPEGDGGDAVAAALRDEELAKKVVQYVPAVAAENLGARGGREPRGGL